MQHPSANGSASRGLRHRGWTMLVVAVVASAMIPTIALAQTETPAEQAAREIQDARDRANSAADEYFAAQSVLDGLEDDLAELEVNETQLQATVDELRSDVELVAVSRYVQSGTEGIPLLTDVSEPQDQIQADVYVGILTNTGADTLDQYDAAQTALTDTQAQVADRQDDVEAQREEFSRLEDVALAEVERLRGVEDKRLQDEAVQKALAAQVAADQAAIEEQARIDAEAAARAQPNPGLVVPSTTEPPPPVVDDGPPTTDAEGNVVTAPTTTMSNTLPPETTIPASNGGSGGTSAGRTGGGGGGNGPGAINAGGTFVDAIICPAPGASYGDTWGAARSGGRRHEGVDMIAPRGLPLYAVVNGVVTFKQNNLGGNAVSLVGDNGNRYYYAHLDRYEGSSRRVFQGEVIGYVGDTGNARFSTPHLHFEVHPGGGLAVNPYPTVRAAGC